METIITTIILACLYTFLGGMVYRIYWKQDQWMYAWCVTMGVFWPVSVPLSLFVWLGKKVVDKIL
jgi:hypothetical protein